MLDREGQPLSPLNSGKRRPSPRVVVGALAAGLLFLSALTYLTLGRDPVPDVPKTKLESWQNGVYEFMIIADKDKDSKVPNKSLWHSTIITGTLTRDASGGNYKIALDAEKKTITSALNEGGRGMELSDLVRWRGKLYTCDDRSGTVFQLLPDEKGGIKPVPFVILNDGDGKQNKGFKCEWLTVKDGNLYAGGFGKEFTDENGLVVNHWPEYIKIVEPSGHIQSVNWMRQYKSLRAATGYQLPGYLLHESAAWSDIHKLWVFLPRRASKTAYKPEEDELKGTNILITANDDFSSINSRVVAPLNLERGFSSLKFVPLSGDQLILALKTKEVGTTTETWVTLFNYLDGKILIEDTFVDNHKYEGLEFV
jgi:soluble calcium-activated nucleotidase 1